MTISSFSIYDDLIDESAYSSMPSKGVNQSDIPIPDNVSSEFQYNYFVADETTSRDVVVDGESRTSFTTLSDDASESERRAQLVEVGLPRFNKISWSPKELRSVIDSDEDRLEVVDFTVSIADNVENILFEDIMTSNQYSGIGLQDAEGLTKLTDVAKIAINSSEIEFEFASSTTSNESSDSNLDVVNSYLEAVGSSTGLDSNAKETLRTALASYQSVGDLSFFNQSEDRTALINDSFSNTSTVFDLGISVSNVLAGRCGNAWSKDGGSSYFEEFNTVKSILSSISTAAVTANTAGSLSDDDYDISAEPVTYKISQNMADQTDGSQYSARVVGYLIEKDEVDESGNVLTLDPIIIENPLSGDAIDPNIMYGRGYRYRVRTIAYLEFSAINVYPGNESRNQSVVVGVLIASRPSKTATSICIERIPPPPPTDIEFVWDGKSESLDIAWSMPVNRQRDVKEFRVFRRLDTSSPFQLIKNYYFNDSTTLTKTTEIPDPDSLVQSTIARLSGALIQVADSPQLLYRDKDFNHNSLYIYSIASVDARGLCSNYSAQFSVSYDKFKSRLIVSYLSKSGAPIPYPNLYLRNDLFKDTIKTSGFNQLTIYFDPEYLTVTNSDGDDLNIMATSDDNPSYKLSMMNLDNQKSKLIDIYVKDTRDNLFEVGEGVDYSVTTKVATLIDV